MPSPRLFLATLLASLTLAGSAAAHDDDGAKAQTEHAPSAAEGDAKEAEAEERTWSTTADLMVGATTFDVFRTLPEGRNIRDSSRITTASLLVGVEHELTPNWAVGVRAPVVFGSVASRGSAVATQNELILGNLELEGAYKRRLNEHMTFELALGVALPTGAGEEPPLEVADDGQVPKLVLADRRSTRFAVARGAEFVRGSLESALFESERFGVVPKVGLPLTFGKLRIRPSVKLESLFDVAGNAEEPVIGELVAGARVSYRVTPVIEPELHAWTNLTFTNHVEREVNVLVGEATLHLHFGALEAFAGAVIPFVGRLTTDNTFGIRVGGAARF